MSAKHHYPLIIVNCPLLNGETCRRFEPKLTQVAKDNDLTVYYLNSENQDSVTQDLRLTYNIPTVPALVVAKSGKVRVVCDSSLSEAVILDFINQD